MYQKHSLCDSEIVQFSIGEIYFLNITSNSRVYLLQTYIKTTLLLYNVIKDFHMIIRTFIELNGYTRVCSHEADAMDFHLVLSFFIAISLQYTHTERAKH